MHVPTCFTTFLFLFVPFVYISIYVLFLCVMLFSVFLSAFLVMRCSYAFCSVSSVFFLIFLFVDVVYLCFLSCRWFTSCNVPFHVRFTMCSLCFSSYAPHRVSGEGWWGWGWGVVGWSKNVHVYLRSGFVGLLDSPGLEHLA